MIVPASRRWRGPTREEVMRRSQLALLFVASLGGAASGSGQQAVPPGVAQPGSPIALVGGAYSFRTYCASCHGVDAKGDGPLAENLRFHPPDLTLIAKRNGGEFPTEKVTQIVDGRKPLKGHGGTEMPVWGDALRNAETGYDEASVKAKIRDVVDYLKTVQARAP
jgi:mono/diheme cytochrome c family protein